MKQLHHTLAERSLIAAVLRDDTLLDRVDLPSDASREFHDMRHGAVWRALHVLHVGKKPVGDPALIIDALGGEAEAVGEEFVLDLFCASTDIDNAAHYAEQIREAALTRRVLAELGELRTNDLGGSDLVAAALQRLSGLGGQRAPDAGVPMSRLAQDVLNDVVAAQVRQEIGGGTWGLPTGLPELDGILGGLQRGVVTILAGRPSMGKSSLARTLADNVAGVAGCGGAHVFSLEDSRRAYAIRVLSDRSRVPLRQIRGLSLKSHALADLQHAATDLGDRANWIVDDSTGLSASQIAMRVRRHKDALKTAIVVVDYVQLLREPTARGDKRREVDTAMEGLVDLARKEDVALVLLSQLSRKCDERDDKRPLLSDLRESGTLEQGADAVLFLYRPDVYGEQGPAELIVRKNKHGQQGTVKLSFDGPTATYRALEWRDRTPPPEHWSDN